MRIISIVIVLLLWGSRLSSYAQTYNIDIYDTQTISSCGGTFSDSQSKNRASGNCNGTNEYCDNEDYWVTFDAGVGNQVRLNFLFYNIESFDALTFHDGNSTLSPVLSTLNGFGYTSASAGGTTCESAYVVTSTGRYMTVHFTSDGSVSYDNSSYYGGWSAIIGCTVTDCGPTTPAASDFCGAATEICNLDGYCGNTSGWYTAGPESCTIGGNFGGSFCGSIENNSWVSFVADATDATLTINSYNCVDANSGVQAMVFSTPDCSAFTGVSNCVNQTTGSGSDQIVATGLTIGQTYYVMIDGYAGNNCDYDLTVEAGVAVMQIIADGIDIDSTELCPGECTNLSLLNATGATGYSWYTVPASTTGSSATFNVCPASDMMVYCDVTGSCGGVTTVAFNIKSTPIFFTGLPATMTCADASVNLLADAKVTPCIYIQVTSNGQTASQTIDLLEDGTSYWGTNTLSTISGVDHTFTYYQVSPSATHQINLQGNNTADMTISVYDCSNNNLLWTGTWLNPPGSTQNNTYTVSTPGTVQGLATWSSTCGGLAQTDWGLAVFDPSTLAGPFPVSCDITYDWDNENGCVGSETQTVTVTSPFDASFNYAAVTYCQSDTDPVPTVTGSGTGTFSSTAGLVINSTNGTVDLSASTPGTYTVTHTVGTGGCADSKTFVITINPPPTATISGGGTICAGDPIPDISIALTGTGPWTVTYTDGTTPATVNPASSPYVISGANDGTYVLTSVSDANCAGTTSGSATITTNPLPTATVSGGGTICAGDPIPDVSIALTGTGPWTVTYTDGTTPTTVNPAASPYVISGGGDGTYTVTSVSDANCTGTTSGSATITTNPLPTATVSGGGTICAGDPIPDVSIALTGTGPWTVTYTDGTTPTTVNPAASPYVISGGGDGTYTVTSVSDANCAGTTSGSATITTNPLPTATVSGGGTICTGDPIPNISIALTGTGPWTVTYTDGTTPTTVNPAASPYVISGGGDATYTVTSVSDANCTGTSSGSATITTNPLPTATVSGGGTICAGDPIPDVSIALTGTGPWTVTYTDGTTPTTVNPAASPYVISGGGDGTYTVTSVSDANCTGTSSGSATIVTTPLPAAPTTSSDPTYCSGDPIASITASGTGGTLTWYSDAGLSTIIGTGGSITPSNTIGVTLYYVTESTAGGCEGPAAIVTVTINALPVIDSENFTDATTCGVSDGTITIVASGGTGSYNYSIDGGSTFPNTTGIFTGLPVNSYQVVINDGNCQVSGSIITISAPSTPTAPVAGTNANYCEGDAVADLTATTSAGGTLTWYDDAGLTNVVGTGTTFTPASTAGNYTYYVTETASGCQGASSQITINISTIPTATVTGGGTICFGDPIPDVVITLTGTSPWNLTYTDGTTSTTVAPGTSPYTISAGSDGVYSVTSVSDVTGCTGTFSGSVTLFTNPDLTGSVSGGGTICAGDPIPDVTFTLAGTSPWDLTYSDGTTPTTVTVNTSPYVITGASDGTYTITGLTDPSGCPATLSGSATITTNPLPTATVSGGGTICAGDPIPDVSIALTGTGPWTVTYTDGTTPATVNPVASPYVISGGGDGTYTVTSVSDANCTGTSSGSATIITNPIPTATVSGGGTICAGDPIPDVSIALTGTGSWTVTYTDGTTPTTVNPAASPYVISGGGDGTYTVTSVSDANCTGTSSGSATIITNPIPTATVSGGGTICAGDPIPDVSIALTGTGPWTVTYTDGTTPTTVNSAVSPYVISGGGDGTYSVTSVTDANCTGIINGSASIVTNPLPTATISGGGTICAGDPIPDVTITLTGTAPWDVTYFDGTNSTTVSVGASPYIISNGIDGTYSVTVVSDVNCVGIASGTANITTNQVPTATVSGGGTICAGTAIPNVQISLTGVSPWTVTYTDGTTPTTVTVNSSPYIISNGGDGVYTVTAVSDPNCTGTASGSATITTNPLPTAVVSGGGTICAGSPIPDVNIALTGTGPWDIVYSNGSTTTNVTANTSPYTISGAGDGTYTVVSVSDQNCTGTSSGSATILTNIVPNPPTAGSDATYCFGEVISDLFAVSTGGALNWYSDAGLITAVGSGTSLTPASTVGTYTYYVTETQSGCESTSTLVTVVINDVPVIDSEVATDATACGVADGTITIAASGGTGSYNFSIDGGSTFPNTTGSFTGLGVNSYQVVVDDGNCQVTGSVLTISAPSTPVAPAAGTNATYCEGDAMNDLTATAGSGGSLSWYDDPGLTNLVGNQPTFTPSNAVGTHVYYVTETVAGCQSPSAQVTVIVNATPLAPVLTGGAVYCDGNPISSLQASATGAHGTFYWFDDLAMTNNVGTGTVYTPSNTIGTTTYYVVDSLNGCAGPVSSVDVTINPTPTFTVVSTNPTSCGGADGQLIISGLDPNTTYDVGYSMNGSGVPLSAYTSDANGEIIIGGLAQGGYASVSVTLNGCLTQSSSTFTLVDPAMPTFTVASNSPVTCGGTEGELILSGLTPSTLYQVDYLDDGVLVTGNMTSNAVGTIVISGLDAGVYTDVTVVLSGCSTTVTGPFTLTDPNSPTYTVGNPQNPSGCGIANASITISGLDPFTTYNLTYDLNGVPVGPVSFTTDGSGNYILGGLQGGGYDNFSVELNGCTTANSSYIPLVPFYPTAPIVFTDSVYCEGEVIADLNGIGAFGGTMNWYDTPPTYPVNSVTPIQSGASPSTYATGVSSPGTYTYWVTETLNGCEGDSSSISVTILPSPQNPIAAGDTSYCESQTIVSISAAAQSGGTLEWYSDSTLTTLIGSGNSFTPGSALGVTTYYVIEVLGNCASGYDSVNVNIDPAPVASFTATPLTGTFPLSVDFTDQSSGTGISYSWNFDDGGTSTDVNPSNEYVAVGSYYPTLVVVDVNGCMSADSIEIVVEGVSELIVPNIFTPNGDEENDLFNLKGTNIIEIDGTIINRWGQIMYTINAVEAGWDGRTLAGEEASEGTYYYIIHAVGADGAVYDVEGPLQLVR